MLNELSRPEDKGGSTLTRAVLLADYYGTGFYKRVYLVTNT